VGGQAAAGDRPIAYTTLTGDPTKGAVPPGEYNLLQSLAATWEADTGFVYELNDGDRRVVSCDGVEVGVFKVDGQFVAWHNQCPHREGPVCQGRIYQRVLEPVADDGTVRALAYDERATNIVCSWHGYEFDLKTGVNQGSDKIRLRQAKLEQKDGNIYVAV